jgi:15-cis-phytoene synthase
MIAPPDAPPAPREWRGYMQRHGRSFSFAAAFMSASERARVSAVYAWCRYTDDIVDRAPDPAVTKRLDDWLERSRAAYDGKRTGIELLDRVMTMARHAEVPFTYPAELIAGMQMDVRHRPYETLRDLKRYRWRVAGTVGMWLTELYGVREPWVLERAAMLGEAMQLTNIIRDVGEDLSRGRLYLPLELMRAHGVSEASLRRARAGDGAPGDGWPALVEELIAIAERDYAQAAAAFPALPRSFRRTVAVAASVYAGIHGAVRRIGYDTLRRRASTSSFEKLALAARALARPPRQWVAAGGALATGGARV